MSDNRTVRVWYTDGTSHLGVSDLEFADADAVDLFVDESKGLYLRVNLRHMRLQRMEDGCVVDEAEFTPEQLFALVRHGVPRTAATPDSPTETGE